MPFEVKAGETVYLGNFEASVSVEKNALGISVGKWRGFQVRNLAEHDLKIAQQKNKQISTDAFTNVTPDPKTLKNAFF